MLMSYPYLPRHQIKIFIYDKNARVSSFFH